jgi:hypothetical protein
MNNYLKMSRNEHFSTRARCCDKIAGEIVFCEIEFSLGVPGIAL